MASIALGPLTLSLSNKDTNFQQKTQKDIQDTLRELIDLTLFNVLISIEPLVPKYLYCSNNYMGNSKPYNVFHQPKKNIYICSFTPT